MAKPSSIDLGPKTGGDARGRRSGLGRYLCVFRMEASRYAVDATLVSEVFSVQRVSAVPLRPAWLLGLHNLRGTPLPVVELQALLLGAAGMRPHFGPLTVIAFQRQDIHVGGRVDRVESVRPWNGLSEPSPGQEGVRGLVRFSGDSVPVALLDDEVLFRRLQLTRATGAPPSPSTSAIAPPPQ